MAKRRIYRSSTPSLHKPTIEPPFVCYVLCYPWSEPFYVGAGRRSRVHDWLTGTGSAKHLPAYAVITDLRAHDMEPDVFLACMSFSVADVLTEERRLIAHYRAAGVPLVNVHQGGSDNYSKPRLYAPER